MSDLYSGEMPKNDEEWAKKLTPEQYHVLREKGTEVPFSGLYSNSKAEGMYRCVGCGNELFSYETKFDSGTGWPSFYESLKNGDDENVIYAHDDSHGMQRTEVMCRRCGGHLGHVFDDGPNPTGKRYCINSCALNLEEDEK